MKKSYLILAAMVSVALTGCMNDEYLGETPKTGESTTDAIQFGSGFNAMTRANITGATAAGLLSNEMKVFGVKQDKETSKYKEVFGNFTMKYDEGKADNADYNNGWYYAGIGTQTIRYWDYSALGYHFVAGSPVANFTYAVDETTKDIKTATITGLGGRLNHETTVASTLAPVYIAEPKNVAKPTGTKYGEVEFTFKSMQSKVRVGIYETIPGYNITSIKFYNNAATPSASNYITLNGTSGYFQGSASATGTVTYIWGATPGYEFAYTSSTITADKCWEGGQFTAGVKAKKSTDPVADLYGTDESRDANGYFIVMPTPSAVDATPLTIKCDYILTSDDEVDVIKVTGASATIPAAYTKWATNTAYTYLFKITDNTNGTTGDDPDDPTGLYPITFDAVVVNVADAGQIVGTETTVSTPSITVTQDNNVVEGGITYSTSPITVTVMSGTDNVTSTATIQHIVLNSFEYGSDYEKLGTWVAGAPSGNLTAGKTYVIKATSGTDVAYFVLSVPNA
jgi:hypothetical protein